MTPEEEQFLKEHRFCVITPTEVTSRLIVPGARQLMEVA